jgi:sarcosine oxidase
VTGWPFNGAEGNMRVIVIGAGIVGMSASHALRKLGHEVLLLDQGEIPNPLSASCDRHRIIRLAHSPGDGRGELIHAAFDAWNDLWHDLGRCHYVETGVIMTASSDADWAASCRHAFDDVGTTYDVWMPMN